MQFYIKNLFFFLIWHILITWFSCFSWVYQLIFCFIEVVANFFLFPDSNFLLLLSFQLDSSLQDYGLAGLWLLLPLSDLWKCTTVTQEILSHSLLIAIMYGLSSFTCFNSGNEAGWSHFIPRYEIISTTANTQHVCQLRPDLHFYTLTYGAE